MDNDPQVFLGTLKAASKKRGEKLLIPDFVCTSGAYDDSFEEEQELGGPLCARIVTRAAKSKPQT